MKSITRLSLVVALATPFFAFAQYPGAYTQQTTTFFSGGVTGAGFGTCASNICYVAGTIVNIINNVLVPVLFAIAFIVFLYGIAKAYIFSGGDPAEVAKGHKLLLWGLIAFVVMISVWGLVNVVANTFGLQGAYAPPLPSSLPAATYP